jgi:aryl-alcohol dehydrogenase-like predicted oxidoreductase
VIATKGGWDRPGPGQWTHDASPEHLRKAVDGSLKRLRLHRIDVYQLHVPDPVDVMLSITNFQFRITKNFTAHALVTRSRVDMSEGVDIST